MRSAFTICLFACILCSGFGQSDDPLLRLKLLLLDDRLEELLGVTDTIAVADSLVGQVYYFRSRAYQSRLNYDSAYHYYQRAFQTDSSYLAFRVSMGHALAKLGRIRETIEIYEAIAEEFHPGAKHLAELANLYSIRREYANSLAICRDLLDKDSLNDYYFKQAGNNFMDMQQIDSALLYYEHAFSLNQKDVFLAHQLGNLNLRKQDLDTAIMRVSTGLFHDSANLDLLKLRGYLCLHSHMYNQAIPDLEKAWLQDSMSVFTNKYLGMCYHEKKQFDKARIALMRAFKLDSTDAETAFFLGEPFVAYDMALACDPADNTIYFKIGQVHDRNLNQKKTAIEYYEKYLSEGSTDQQLFNAGQGTSCALEQHVRERINRLKEELFFENPVP